MPTDAEQSGDLTLRDARHAVQAGVHVDDGVHVPGDLIEVDRQMIGADVTGVMLLPTSVNGYSSRCRLVGGTL